ncbi:MAG: ribokinase, partial [Gallicola sp.]|nr:ribokinase [Gallicola sp.]
MKILNMGSLNIDLTYSVHHIVRPGETIESTGLKTLVGGKGLNQSTALARVSNEV